jgi:signal transduction histidine kinase
MTRQDADEGLVDSLRRQLSRERQARRDAEVIAEQRLRELWQANESHRSDRADELEELRGAAEAAAHSKRSFLAHVGNALETPLHAVLGNLELLDLRALPEEERELLRTAEDAAKQLAVTVAGLMELVASEGRPFEPTMEQRSLVALLDAIDDRWQRRLAARGQLLVTELSGDDSEVIADWGRLEQVADRLLDNVERHAGPGIVRVSLGGAAGLLTFEVADSGPGFPVEHRDDVLLPFFRVDAAPGSAKAGVGIGLAVAVRLLEAAGGSLRVEPSEDGTLAVAVMPTQRRRAPRR